MPKTREKDSAGNGSLRSVKVPNRLWQRLKVVAQHRGLSRTQAIEKYAGPVIDREYRKAVEEAHRDLGENGAG